MRKKSPWLLMIILVLLAADQLTKIAVRAFLEPEQSFRVLVFFSIVRIQNPGIAFGMLGNYGGLIIFISIMVVLILVVAILASRDDAQLFWPLALLIAGSSGNLIDRLVLKSVTDFIRFPRWPAFNLADIFVVVGVLLLIRVLLRRPRGAKAED